jgi:hypothetical protein
LNNWSGQDEAIVVTVVLLTEEDWMAEMQG